MGFRRRHDGSVMVYTKYSCDKADYVMGEYLARHPLAYCIEEVLDERISRIRLPADVVRYVIEHPEERRAMEWHRDYGWCHVVFDDEGLTISEGYTSPEGLPRRRMARFSVTGFVLACFLCKLAESGRNQLAGELESGQRSLRAEGLVGYVPEGWRVMGASEKSPVVL